MPMTSLNAGVSLQKKLRHAAWAVVSMIGLALAGPALAQALPDPTKPPRGFVDPDEQKSGTPAASIATPDPDAGLVFQSAVLPKNGKPVAVIGGRYVPVGGKVDGWELRAMNEREAVLVQGAERRVLKLTPQVVKTPVVNDTEPMKKAAPKKKPKKATNQAAVSHGETKPKKSEKASCNDELKPK